MHKIKQAVIPIAGLATRLYPMNKFTKKALLPICDIDGRVKPVIMKLLEELDEAGIEKIYLIISKEDKKFYNNLFKKASKDIINKLSDEDKLYDKKINKISKKISYIIQDKKLGFGDAVYLARTKLNEEPVIVLLGDTIYKSNEDRSSVEQLLSYFDEIETPVVALKELEEKELKYYSVVSGNWENEEKTKMVLNQVIEKPSVEYAKEHLLLNKKFFGNFGELILTKEIFDEFEKIMNIPIENGQEYQLMDAFDKLSKTGSVHGLLINGNSYDMGNIEAYINVLRSF